MAQEIDAALLRQPVAAHLPVDAGRVCLEPIRTGKHNRSYWIYSDQGEAVPLARAIES